MADFSCLTQVTALHICSGETGGQDADLFGAVACMTQLQSLKLGARYQGVCTNMLFGLTNAAQHRIGHVLARSCAACTATQCKEYGLNLASHLVPVHTMLLCTCRCQP